MLVTALAAMLAVTIVEQSILSTMIGLLMEDGDKLGAKLGDKLGAKLGVKLGVKLGDKVERINSVGSKVGMYSASCSTYCL
jgi:hypothetical protein